MASAINTAHTEDTVQKKKVGPNLLFRKDRAYVRHSSKEKDGPNLLFRKDQAYGRHSSKEKDGPNLFKERPSTRKVQPKEKDGLNLFMERSSSRKVQALDIKRQVFAMTKSIIKHDIQKCFQ